MRRKSKSVVSKQLKCIQDYELFILNCFMTTIEMNARRTPYVYIYEMRTFRLTLDRGYLTTLNFTVGYEEDATYYDKYCLVDIHSTMTDKQVKEEMGI